MENKWCLKLSCSTCLRQQLAPESKVSTATDRREGNFILPQGWRKHLCSVGTKEISWRNPVELSLLSIYNGLVMNTVIICGKITQQGKLFWLKDRENQERHPVFWFRWIFYKVFSRLKAQNFSSNLIHRLDALGSLKLVFGTLGTSDKD